jgi:hypothetical protein
MNVLVGVDDTDNLETKGTGHLTEHIAQQIEANGWGRRSYITRHQLFVHPDVPYTSHNSAMCFASDLEPANVDAFILEAATILRRDSATGSDPGLCVAIADHVRDPAPLLEFGRRAKRAVVTQDEAYALARQLEIHLSGHGGTGGGVIGALAGVGLRMSGDDGRVRGGLDIAGAKGVATVGEILARTYVDEVRTLERETLRDGDPVRLVGEKIKAVLQDGMAVLLVIPVEGECDGIRWQTCPKDLLKSY